MSSFTDLWCKHREGGLYLICGAGTVLVSWATYALFVWAGVDVNVSNMLSWLCAVSFAFIVNKWVVFLSRSVKKETLMKEISSFFFLRIMTGLVRIGLFPVLFYTLGLSGYLFGVEGFMSIIILTIIEIMLNYIASKYVVFRIKNESAP